MPAQVSSRWYRHHQWIVGFLICLSTLAMFSWKARHDDHLTTPLEEAASYVHVHEESQQPVLIEDSNVDNSSEEEGFDVLHTETATAEGQTDIHESVESTTAEGQTDIH